jgi:hypothetical protein
LPSWARLLAKVYQVDPLACPRCAKRMSRVAFVTDQVAIGKILDHLGLSSPAAEKPPPPAREVLRVAEHGDGWGASGRAATVADPNAYRLAPGGRCSTRGQRRRASLCSFFRPEELRDKLAAAGFHAIDDLGLDEINARYFGGGADGLRVSGVLGRPASAEL